MGLLGNWIGPETSQVLDDFGRGLLMTNDFGKGAAYGFQAMDDRRKKGLLSGALQGNDPKAMGLLMQEDPELGMKIQEQRRAQAEATRARFMWPLAYAAQNAKTNPALFEQAKALAAQGGFAEAASLTPETAMLMGYEGAKPAAQQNTQLGMTPIWGTNAQGKPVLLQMGQGSLVQAATPEGVTLTPGVQMVNTGTSIVPVSNRTGAPAAAPIPIDVAGAAYAGAAGKSAAESVANAPKSIQAGEQISKSIDGVMQDPAFNLGTGALGVVTRNIPGTSTYDFGARASQLKGQAFLQAFESLKGGGQITEIEGQKATDAIARLDAAQSPQAYRAALQEFKSIVDTVTARQRAVLARGQGGMGQPPAVSPPPAQPSAPSASDPLGWR